MHSAADGHSLVDLTADLIFDHCLYLSEALDLPHGQDEEQLNSQLAISARESGIEDPYRYLAPHAHHLATTMSSLTLSSEQRSSVSIHSQESNSTGLTSHPSRTSRDHAYPVHLPVPPPRSTARPSLSIGYASVVHRFSTRQKPLASTVSHATSLVSSASSLPNFLPRKHRRPSALFARFRKDSSSCSSRSHHHHRHHVRPQGPKLECGHSLSKYAIRVHIQEALDNTHRVAPTCCGKPLPRAVLESVLTKEEADIVTLAALPSPDVSSLRDSGYSEDGMSLIDIPRELHMRAHASESCTTAQAMSALEPAPMDQEHLDIALADEVFTKLTSRQRDEFQRVSQFEANQRKALSAYHAWSLSELTRQFDSLKEETQNKHALELERLDESQIMAEHDMHKLHAQEAQNAATALKYMAAYCSGSTPSHPDRAHVVTEEDRRKLARQHLLLQKLPAKHDSAINVLRAKQEKDTKLKIQKQQAELRQLDADYEADKKTTELQHRKDWSHLDATIESRRQKLMHRWDLNFEIWRRDWESRHGRTLPGRIPHEEWPVRTDPDTPVDPTSSLALYNEIKV